MNNDLIVALRNIAASIAEDDGTHEGAVKGWVTRHNGGKQFNGIKEGVYYKGSAPLPKSFQPGATKSKYRMMRNKHVLAKLNSGDGTFDLETGKPVSFDDGWQVAFQTFDSEDPSAAGYVSDADYDKRVDSIAQQLGVKPNLGTFGIPEISFHVESPDQAMEIAKRFNQHSIFNWKSMRCKTNPNYDSTTNKIMR